MAVITDCSYSPQLLLVSDRNVVLLVHDVVLTLILPSSPSADSAAVVVANELKISKYIGDGVHIRQAVVIHTDYKSVVDQFTVAVWTSADDLCILDGFLLIALFYSGNYSLISSSSASYYYYYYRY